MSDCPKCRQRLMRTKTDAGLLFQCPQCRGRAVGLSVLRRAIPPAYARTLWIEASKSGAPRGQPCPICRRAMAEVSVSAAGREVSLDVCAGCQFVWFDPHEFEQFPQQPRKDEKARREQLPEKVREAMALADLDLEEKRRRGGEFGAEAPDDAWKHIPAFFGMPVEHDVNPIRCWPWVTWTLAAVMAVVYLLTFNSLEHVVAEFGLVPAQALRHGGITFVTGFFLHAGLFHLIGNAYFLLIFGDNVEDHLGAWRYLLLVAVAAFAGDVLHILADPRAMLPCVGASGGISAVIAFYAFKFPHARLGFMVRYWFAFRWFHVPAWAALIVWFLLQFVLASQQLAGVGTVSALAHLGGAGVGVAAWLLWRERPEDSDEKA